MSIRRAVPEDAENLAFLIEGTVRLIYPAYYPQGIVDFFVHHHRQEVIEEDISAGCVYVSEVDGEIVGTVTLHGDRMDRLFVHPARQGRGYGKELILFSEETVFSEHNQMVVESALPSVEMYDSNGFRTITYNSREYEGCTLVFPIMVKPKPDIVRD